jgi:hypothetical protein
MERYQIQRRERKASGADMGSKSIKERFFR